MELSVFTSWQIYISVVVIIVTVVVMVGHKESLCVWSSYEKGV